MNSRTAILRCRAEIDIFQCWIGIHICLPSAFFAVASLNPKVAASASGTRAAVPASPLSPWAAWVVPFMSRLPALPLALLPVAPKSRPTAAPCG